MQLTVSFRIQNITLNSYIYSYIYMHIDIYTSDLTYAKISEQTILF